MWLTIPIWFQSRELVNFKKYFNFSIKNKMFFFELKTKFLKNWLNFYFYICQQTECPTICHSQAPSEPCLFTAPYPDPTPPTFSNSFCPKPTSDENEHLRVYFCLWKKVFSFWFLFYFYHWLEMLSVFLFWVFVPG